VRQEHADTSKTSVVPTVANETLVAEEPLVVKVANDINKEKFTDVQVANEMALVIQGVSSSVVNNTSLFGTSFSFALYNVANEVHSVNLP